MALPGTPASTIPPGDDWIARRLRDLQRQVDELKTARSLESSTIGRAGITVSGGGSLRVLDDAGNVIAYIGGFADGSFGAEISRADGSVAFEANQDFVALRDQSGAIIVSDDATSGKGLATPYIGGAVWIPTNVALWPATTNGTFTGIANALYMAQNPKLQWSIQHGADAGTAGQVRLIVNGTQVGTTQNVSSSFAFWTQFGVDLPAGIELFSSLVDVSVEAKRTSGTGKIYAAVQWFAGDRSP